MQPPVPISTNPAVVMLPFFEGKVRSGQSHFVSAAQDYEMKKLDLNELLITNPPATFMVRITN